MPEIKHFINQRKVAAEILQCVLRCCSYLPLFRHWLFSLFITFGQLLHFVWLLKISWFVEFYSTCCGWHRLPKYASQSQRNTCFFYKRNTGDYIWEIQRTRSEKCKCVENSWFAQFSSCSFCGGHFLPESFYPTHDLFATAIARYFSFLIQPKAKYQPRVLLNWQILFPCGTKWALQEAQTHFHRRKLTLIHVRACSLRCCFSCRKENRKKNGAAFTRKLLNRIFLSTSNYSYKWLLSTSAFIIPPEKLLNLFIVINKWSSSTSCYFQQLINNREIFPLQSLYLKKASAEEKVIISQKLNSWLFISSWQRISDWLIPPKLTIIATA